MSSAPENRAEREGSFFSRVARSIRRALSRICRNSSSSSSDSVPNHRYSQEDYIPIIRGGSRIPYEYYGSLIGQKRKNSNEYPQISKRGDALNFTVHPESEPEVSDVLRNSSVTADSLSDWHDDCNFAEAMTVSHPMPSRPDFRFKHTSCESIAPPVDAQGSATVLHDTNICTEGSGTQYGLHFSVQSNGELSADRVAQVEAPIAVTYLFPNTLPAPSHLVPPTDRSRSSRVSSCLSRSHSMPSQSQIAKPLTRAQSLPALLLKSCYGLHLRSLLMKRRRPTGSRAPAPACTSAG